ncbi:MAG TPA: PAS domain S-box protein [Vicinamibacterales bacterium]|nr:PAS domain S-box protein [Vicinamibacterales bacterium]
MRRRAAVLVVALLALPFDSHVRAPFDSRLQAQTPADARSGEDPSLAQALVYGGDREFPPYEYVDETDQPQGFNIHLIRALAKEAGMAVEIRLGQRDERMKDFDEGRTDVMFLTHTEDRAARYQLLDQTWTLAQVVMMRPGLPRYPTGLDDLWGTRIAVDSGSINHTLLAGLPESRRPALQVVASRSDAIRAFERAEVDGVAGNHLTMRFLMGPLAENAVEVPLISRPYHLAVLPGRENVVAPLRVALDRMKASGEFDRLVELHLGNPTRRTWLDRYATILAIGGGVALLLFVGGTAWNRSLHRQVQARTKAVERTERRYRDLVDNASDMIYRTDPFGRFTFVNPVATRILGFDEGELLSMKYFELMRPDWVPRAMGFYEKAAKTRESTYLEFPVRKKDGQEIWVGQHVRPIITAGRIEGFQGMARDITDRVNAQAELRAERDFVSAILDTAPSLVMVLDSNGDVVRFNRACEELSGVTMSEVAGRPIWELPFLLDEDRGTIRQNIPRLAAATAPVKLDRTWVGRTGTRHVIAWTVMALRAQSGATSYLIGIGSDVTTARELERLKSQFISMVSHELRTPLTSIRASMQLLIAEHLTGTEDAERLVKVALSNADRLIRIVNDILDMSKIEAGEMMVMPKRTRLQPIIEDSVRSVEAVARDAGVTIVQSHNGVGEVLADPDRTIQVLVNLLSNAVKHSPGGSKVEVTSVLEPGVAAVSVRDSGPGIPAHKVDFIFEPFTQLDASDTRRIAGTGLGLTIARALAEKQGGGIRVSSREGGGATFTLTLPLA